MDRKIKITEYNNGNMSVLLLEDGAPYCQLSTNIPGCMLPFGSFVLNHDANDLVEWMDSTGLFEKTKSTVSYGFVDSQPIYRLVSQ